MKKNKRTNQPDTDSSFDFDSFSDEGPLNTVAQEEDDPFSAQAHVKAPRGGRGLSGKALLVIVLCLVLAGGAAAWFLTRPNTSESKSTAGAAAPAGLTERVDVGRDRLLNELLVITDESLSQKQLEVELLKMEGAILGYLPEIRQYQIRFNTDSRSSLDEKKAQIEQIAGVLRADYNYQLALTADQAAAEAVTSSIVADKTLGLMGGLPPRAETLSVSFFLPSASFPDEESFRLWLDSHPNAAGADCRTDAAAALLESSGKQAFASCFHYEQNRDGTLSGYTTSFALRVQLAALVRAGVDTVVFPFLGPVAQDAGLNTESEQDELLFNALEQDHPHFTLCKAWAEGDSLIQAIAATETGRKHLLTVAAYGGSPVPVLDASGTGRPVYRIAASVAGADLAAPGGNAESAVVYAAARVSDMKASRPDVDMAAVKEECGAWAADVGGNVISALDETAAGVAGTYRLVTLQAHDAITGETIPGVRFGVETSSGAYEETAAGVELKALLPVEDVKLSASTDGFQSASMDLPSDVRTDVLFSLSSDRDYGTVKGRIDLLGSAVSGELTASFLDIQHNIQYPERPVSENYSLPMLPGKYEMTLSGYNRTPVKIHNVQVVAGQDTVNPDVSLSVASDLPGFAAGMVKDAMTGGPLDGAQLSFRAGANAPEGSDEVVSAVTDASGTYNVSLTGGTYTAYVSKEGYRALTVPVICEAEQTIGGQNCTITPNVPEGQVRIILEWGAYPSDLDSHLVNLQQNIHVYYSEKAASLGTTQIANLDVDDTSSYGPETTTILKQVSGKFVFYVHDYSNRPLMNSRALAESEARVRVCIGNQPEQVFNVPNQPGTLWEVFSLENGVLTPSGTMSYCVEPWEVGR